MGGNGCSHGISKPVGSPAERNRSASELIRLVDLSFILAERLSKDGAKVLPDGDGSLATLFS